MRTAAARTNKGKKAIAVIERSVRCLDTNDEETNDEENSDEQEHQEQSRRGMRGLPEWKDQRSLSATKRVAPSRMQSGSARIALHHSNEHFKQVRKCHRS
jgi:hypothetical protein